MIASWESAGLPVAARINSPSEFLPASKSWFEDWIVANGLRAFSHESFILPTGICPCRARICQSPMLACTIPNASARRRRSGIRLSPSATVIKRVIAALLKLGTLRRPDTGHRIARTLQRANALLRGLIFGPETDRGRFQSRPEKSSAVLLSNSRGKWRPCPPQVARDCSTHLLACPTL